MRKWQEFFKFHSVNSLSYVFFLNDAQRMCSHGLLKVILQFYCGFGTI